MFLTVAMARLSQTGFTEHAPTANVLILSTFCSVKMMRNNNNHWSRAEMCAPKQSKCVEVSLVWTEWGSTGPPRSLYNMSLAKKALFSWFLAPFECDKHLWAPGSIDDVVFLQVQYHAKDIYGVVCLLSTRCTLVELKNFLVHVQLTHCYVESSFQ